MTAEVKKLIEQYLPESRVGRKSGRLYTDTSDFMRISYGDVIRLGSDDYLVHRDEVERSYGLEDPKYWVKRCTHLQSGEKKILKLVFHESFPLSIGSFEIQCYRSPIKEARILNLVRGDIRFMQGHSFKDTRGNVVRVIDVIHGGRLDEVVDKIPVGHEEYFFQHFPGILEKFIDSCRAIKLLHDNWEKHGDIRRDHLWVESGTGNYRWIDFDYTFDFNENPFGLDLFGLGAYLLFLTGKTYYTPTEITELGVAQSRLEKLAETDFLLLFKNRIANLRAIFPYVPKELNRVLLHFSSGAEVFYESVDEFLSDLEPCLGILAPRGDAGHGREPQEADP